MRKKIIIAFLLLCTKLLLAQNYQPTWESIDSRPTPEWFANAKFGIFIHWGVYSVPAWAPTGKDIGVYEKYSEWYWQRMATDYDKNEKLNKARDLFRAHHEKTWGKNFNYQNFASMWKAENFQPEQWAELFKQAGAKYVVLTAKHHEGFTLWPSDKSWNWNSVDVGPQRDICGELSKAVKDKNLRMGFYYSLYEWFNPIYNNNVDSYVENTMIPQLKDLVTRYSPEIIWSDGEWVHTSETWKSKEYLSWLFNESPVKNSVVVNDRWGSDTRGKHGSFFTTEYDINYNTDTFNKKKTQIYEECRGIGGSFGYNKNENLNDYQSSEELIHLLINKVANGGNLLLNIGPTADGRIPVIMQQRLTDMGKWLEVNGDAIYDTQIWEGSDNHKNKENLFFTRKCNDLFAITTAWPTKPITFNTNSKVKSVKLLGYKGKIKFSQNGNRITVFAPVFNPTEIQSKYAWAFKLEGACAKK